MSRVFQAAFLGLMFSMAESKRLGVLWWRPFDKEDVALLEGLIQSGSVAPIIDRRYPLREVADALRYLDEGRARGKIVITV